MKKTRETSEHYIWGDNCDGWHLVMCKDLSIIEELMPPNTAETGHYHSEAQQFFYILRGEATFIVMNDVFKVSDREGVHIKSNVYHQIRNDSDADLEFLVISQPTSKADRINVG